MFPSVVLCDQHTFEQGNRQGERDLACFFCRCVKFCACQHQLLLLFRQQDKGGGPEAGAVLNLPLSPWMTWSTALELMAETDLLEEAVLVLRDQRLPSLILDSDCEVFGPHRFAGCLQHVRP